MARMSWSCSTINCGDDATSAAKALPADVTDIRADGDTAVATMLLGQRRPAVPPVGRHHAGGRGRGAHRQSDGTGPEQDRQLELVSAQLARHDGLGTGRGPSDGIRMVTLNDLMVGSWRRIQVYVDAISDVDLKNCGRWSVPGIVVEDVPSARTPLPMFTDTAPFENPPTCALR